MDSSFSSTSPNKALPQDALRANRFLSRNHDGKFQCASASKSNDARSPSNINCNTRIPSPILPVSNALTSCTSSNGLQCIYEPNSNSHPQQCKTARSYVVIEERHDPITTVRSEPLSSLQRVRQMKVRQFMAAKRRAKIERLQMNQTNLQSPTSTSEMETYSSEKRLNESPTTVMADISKVLLDTSTFSRQTNSPNNVNDAIIKDHKSITTPTVTPLKNRRFTQSIGMVPKKKLSWWDDTQNRHKPFCDKASSYFDLTDKEKENDNNRGCPHDNFKDLIEDYSSRFRSIVVDLFHVKDMIETEDSTTSMFRNNFASFSEDLLKEEEEEDNGERGGGSGCLSPTKRLVGVVKDNIIPLVCEL